MVPDTEKKSDTTKVARRVRRRRKRRHTKKVASRRARQNVTDMSDGHAESAAVFNATEAQKRFLEAFLNWDPRRRITVAGVCKKAKVHRDSFYTWRNQPLFLKWFNSHRSTLNDQELMFIERGLLSRARSDNQAAKIFYEKRGELLKRADLESGSSVPSEEDPQKVLELLRMALRMHGLDPEQFFPSLTQSPQPVSPPKQVPSGESIAEHAEGVSSPATTS